MSILGDRSRFAVEVQLHPEASRNISKCYGMFRFWVAGTPYGRDEPDATCLAASFDALREHQKSHLSALPKWVEGKSPQEVIQKAYWLIYEVTEDEIQKKLATNEEVQQARKAVMAPDGDEAFDDGSFVVHWEVGDQIVIAAGKIASEGSTDSAFIHEPIRTIVLAKDEFHKTLSEAIDVFHKLDKD